MPRQSLLKPREIRTALLILLILILLAAAINVPLAVTFIRSRTAPRLRSVDLNGAAAAARGWPARTPHPSPWPAPDYHALSRDFGYRHFHVASIDPIENRQRFSMELELYGWPLPVLERKQMWWDWNDPALRGPEPDPALKLRPLGLIVNPLLLGGAAFLLFYGPLTAWLIARRAWRRQGRQCLYCGYPIGSTDRCTECGASINPSQR